MGLECLAVKASVQHFGIYLHGKEFMIQTDHRALESLLTSRELNPKLTRWALFLQQFSMKITYRPGVKNQNTDGLSRQAWTTSSSMDVGSSEGGGGGGGGGVRRDLTAVNCLATICLATI